MATKELMVVQNHRLVLGHDLQLARGHNWNLELVQSPKHYPGLGQDHQRKLHLRKARNRDEKVPEQTDVIEASDRDSFEQVNQECPDLSCQNNDLALVVVSDNHEIGENLELDMDQNQEIANEAVDNMRNQQPGYFIYDSVVQARSLEICLGYELHVGQEFPDVESCRRALRDTAIALHFEILTIKSDKTRFTARCAANGCPWRIHAAKLPGVPTFTIRTLHDTHTCIGIVHLGHQQASVQWVANSVERRLLENPNCKPKEILEEIHRAHGITLSYKQAWRGKERIMAAMRGSFEEEYRLLPKYCEQLKRTNPGSIASVYGNQTDRCFRCLFISFQATIFGFLNACRPLLGLDRTYLKSKCHGTLLLATGFDGDGALFPLAFGVVDEENDGNWMWFLSELHNLLEINTEKMSRLTILSDRQKAIVDGVDANFPTAFHGFCLRQLSESFHKEFNNTMLTNLFSEAAHALTIIEFESKVSEIEQMSQEAVYWIKQIPPPLWATAYFEGSCFGQLTINSAESLTDWLLEASGLPIIQMMECVRRQLMTWFNERRETSMEWTSVLVPCAERRVATAIELARAYNVLRASEDEFEIISHEGTYVVDISNRCCLCRGWQLFGLPCSHAVAALLSCRQNVRRYTESCFTVATYRKTYSETIHPIPDRSSWNESPKEGSDSSKPSEVVINPPKSLCPPIRPRKKRARSEDNGHGKRVVHCSRCNQVGHFRTTCPAVI